MADEPTVVTASEVAPVASEAPPASSITTEAAAPPLDTAPPEPKGAATEKTSSRSGLDRTKFQEGLKELLPSDRGAPKAKPSNEKVEPKSEKTVATPTPAKDATAPTPTPVSTNKTLAKMAEVNLHANAGDTAKSQFKVIKELAAKAVEEEATKTREVEAKWKKATETIAELTGKTQGEIKELTEKYQKAARYERAFDLQADPEVKAKFVEPADKTFKAMGETLTRAGLDPATLGQIDLDNEIAAEELAVQVEKQLGVAAANIFRQKSASLRDIRSQYQQEQKNWIENGEKIVAEKQKEREFKAQEASGIVEKTLKEVIATKDESGKNRWQFIAPMEVAEGMTPEQIDAVNTHNKLILDSHKRITEFANNDNPADRTEIAVLAELGRVLSHERPILTARIDELTKELEKVQGGQEISRNNANRRAPAEPKERYKRGASISSAFKEQFGD